MVTHIKLPTTVSTVNAIGQRRMQRIVATLMQQTMKKI